MQTQTWIAAAVSVAIVDKRLEMEAGLYRILQILNLTRFEKAPISQALQRVGPEND